MVKSKCFKCKHEQELVRWKNVYQDDTGQWTICEECNNAYGVEPRWPEDE